MDLKKQTQPKRTSISDTVLNKLRWHHALAGLLIAALAISCGLLWRIQSPSTASAQTPPVDTYVYITVSAPGLSGSVELTSLYNQFGYCNGGAAQPFYATYNGTTTCDGYQFGNPPNNPVGLEIDQSVPSGYTYGGWSLTGGSYSGTATCYSSECEFEVTSGSVYVTLTINPPSGGSGGSSGTSGGSTCSSHTPSAPVLSVSSSGQTAVDLSWSASTPGCNSDYISSYAWQYSSNNFGSYTSGSTTGTSASLSGLACGTTYEAKVVAVEGDSGTSFAGTSTSNTATTQTSSCPSSGGSGSSGGASSGSNGSVPTGNTGGSSGGGSSFSPAGNTGSSSGSSSAGQNLNNVGAAAAGNTGNSQLLLSPQGNQSTSTPPNTPTGFTASTDQNSVVVNLTWDSPQSGSAVSSYELDRSSDNGGSWQILSKDIQNTFFTDLYANFSTHYLYRLTAKNSSGTSGYAYADITTSGFTANAGPLESTTLKAPGGIATAVIPKGALDQTAACALAINPILASPDVKNYIPVAGPYTVSCKTQSGSIVQSYAKPLQITINTANPTFNKYKNLAYYGQVTVSQHWSAMTATTNAANRTASFSLTNGYSFIAMGETAHAPWWIGLLVVLLIIGAIVVTAIFGLRFIAKKRQEAAYDISYRKEWGL